MHLKGFDPDDVTGMWKNHFHDWSLKYTGSLGRGSGEDKEPMELMEFCLRMDREPAECLWSGLKRRQAKDTL